MSLAAYRHTQRTAESPRQVEHRVFSQVTAALVDADSRGLSGPQLVTALHRNRELWSALADDCRSPGNRLPDSLRAGIISLALWVDRHSSAVARGEAQVTDLVEINRTVMEGLRPAAAAAAAA
ncbi:MAG: flagellar biosynthesis regulator FlaF [Alphaproteobacteria bacterium]|nr:flagellar biosynthesis regulator FlaF [Alphaproteobacteria bacterium]